MLTGVAASFYETVSAKRGKQSLRKAYERAAECHRKLWPGVVVPEIDDATATQDYSSDSCMPTSLLVAYLVHMFSLAKRKADMRLRAYELLKAFIDRLAVHGPTLDFLISDIHGVGHWETQTLSTAHACIPWSKAFFQHYLQMTWLNDLASQEVPWITSFPGQGQMHLADWIAFSLDFPAWMVGKKANKDIHWAKQVIERSALCVLTQLALRIEELIQNITTNLESQQRGKKRSMKMLKVPKPIKWGYVASAMEMVFAQQDSRMIYGNIFFNPPNMFVFPSSQFQPFLAGQTPCFPAG